MNTEPMLVPKTTSFTEAVQIGIIYSIYAITIVYLGMTVPGWASLVASIVFLSGIQLMVLGVIREYIGKIYRELKQRPTYLLQKPASLLLLIYREKESLILTQ